MFVRILAVMIGCSTFCGCMTFDTTLMPLSELEQEYFNIPTPEETQLSEQLQQLVPGTKIEVIRETENSSFITTGTVMRAGLQGVALVNCVETGRCSHTSPWAKVFGPRLFKNSGVGRSHVPVEWFSAHMITRLRVVEPAPENPDEVAKLLEVSLADDTYFERIGIDFDFNIDESGNPVRVFRESVVIEKQSTNSKPTAPN